jgi:hypothetical protein
MSQTKKENTDSGSNVDLKGKPRSNLLRKPGKTLLMKSRSGSTSEAVLVKSTESLKGLVKQPVKTKTNSYFLCFDSVENASKAFEELDSSLNSGKNKDVLVKYAHYRIFFKIEKTGGKPLSNDDDYNLIKESHIKDIESNTNGKVIYWKLYKNGDSYLGCGDYTVDTLECLENQLDPERGKTFKFGEFEGVNYKYNKKPRAPRTINEI